MQSGFGRARFGEVRDRSCERHQGRPICGRPLLSHVVGVRADRSEEARSEGLRGLGWCSGREPARAQKGGPEVFKPLASARREIYTLGCIGRAYGKTAAQVALRWIIQQNIVAIPRASTIERLHENFEVFDFGLSPRHMTEIGTLARPAARLVNVAWVPQWDR